tara:strand:+ start:744 stop:1076 length:333 start_codon:yes stop_codon:yes gene_type:complete
MNLRIKKIKTSDINFLKAWAYQSGQSNTSQAVRESILETRMWAFENQEKTIISGYKISGNTYPNKRAIKAAGGMWLKKQKTWFVSDLGFFLQADLMMTGCKVETMFHDLS